jgi:hypothetical protein
VAITGADRHITTRLPASMSPSFEKQSILYSMNYFFSHIYYHWNNLVSYVGLEFSKWRRSIHIWVSSTYLYLFQFSGRSDLFDQDITGFMQATLDSICLVLSISCSTKCLGHILSRTVWILPHPKVIRKDEVTKSFRRQGEYIKTLYLRFTSVFSHAIIFCLVFRNGSRIYDIYGMLFQGSFY